MVNAKKFFDAKGTYLNASHVSAGDLKVTISEVKVETIGKSADEKLVVYFEDLPRGLALNKVNFESLYDAFGPETSGWIGGKITLFVVETEYEGQKRDGIRVKVDPANRVPREKWAKPEPAAEMEDEIPFTRGRRIKAASSLLISSAHHITPPHSTSTATT